MNLARTLRLPEAHAIERRDPRGATMTSSYQVPGAPMLAEWDAEQAIHNGYLANVTVFACARINANTLASMPFRVGPNPEAPDEFDKNARLAQLLGPPPLGPNPEIAAEDLLAHAVVQQEITGRMGWELETTGPSGKGDITALWPLIAQFLDAIPADGRTPYYFSGYRYKVNTTKDVIYNRDEVFYHWNPSQHDFRQPESALQAARLDISVAVMQDRYDYAFIKNDNRPATLMVMEAFADKSERDAFENRMNAKYGGPENAGKTLITETSEDGALPKDSVFVQTLGISQRDADFFRRYEQKTRGIAIAMGVPFSKLDASGRTFDNADAEDRTYWLNKMLPMVRRFQNAINIKLAPRCDNGRYVGWFELPGHVKDYLNPTPKMVNFPQVPTAPDPAPAAVEPAPPVPELPAPKRNKQKGETREAVDHEARRAKFWKAVDQQARILEHSWQRAMVSLFNKQEAATVARLEGKRGRQMIEKRAGDDPNAIYDASFWKDETRALAATLYEQVVAVGAGRLADRFAVDFDIGAPYVQDFILARSNQLAGQIVDTTYDAVKHELAEGTAAGESIPDLAKRVHSVFDEATSQRAITIARTEVISAFNGSSALVAAQLPDDVVAAQEWIATRDGRTRPDHAEADGELVGVGAMFSVGGSTMAYPGDPNGGAKNTVNCRCTLAYLTPAEYAERMSERSALRLTDVQKRLVRMALEAA